MALLAMEVICRLWEIELQVPGRAVLESVQNAIFVQAGEYKGCLTEGERGWISHAPHRLLMVVEMRSDFTHTIAKQYRVMLNKHRTSRSCTLSVAVPVFCLAL